jgi:outer membrane lipoprotein carrier protein
MAVCLAASLLDTGVRAADPASTPATRPAAALTPEQSADLLKGVRAKMETAKTVQGEFVQEKNLSMLKHTLIIKGHFAVERPRRLVWHVVEPVKYSIRVENEDVQFWDEDTNRVDSIHIGANHSFRAAFEQFQGWFLGNYATLEQSYDVTVQSVEPLVVSFQPKAGSPMAQMIKRVEVTFQADHLYLASLVIQEGGGDTTTIRFDNIQINKPVPDRAWEIPPQGK